MKKGFGIFKAITLIAVFIIAAVYYYIELPAINIHSPGFWKFIIFVMIIVTIAVWFMHHKRMKGGRMYIDNNTVKEFFFDFKTGMGAVLFKIVFGTV